MLRWVGFKVQPKESSQMRMQMWHYILHFEKERLPECYRGQLEERSRPQNRILVKIQGVPKLIVYETAKNHLPNELFQYFHEGTSSLPRGRNECWGNMVGLKWRVWSV